MRENAQAKGRRYLTEGRLTITHANASRAEAVCKGQGHLYRLRHEQGRYYCDCPAKGPCAHLVALQLVIASEGQV